MYIWRSLNVSITSPFGVTGSITDEFPFSLFLSIFDKELQLEFLTVGDYGKENNIKADFLGLSKEINGVENKKDYIFHFLCKPIFV